MKYAQNLVLNRRSKTRLLLMVFLYLAYKEKKFYKMARSFQPSVPSKKELQECFASLPCSTLLLYLIQAKKKSSLFASLTHLCLVTPGSGTQWTKWSAYCVLLAIGIEKNAFF